jgi:hypothetical protein
MGRCRKSLYEQVYDDLTAAVKRVKQACRNCKPKTLQAAKTSISVSPMNQQKPSRGRPKGSKDTLPRKKKESSKLPTNSPDISALKHTECPRPSQDMYLHQPVGMALKTSTVEPADSSAEMDRSGNDCMARQKMHTMISAQKVITSDAATNIIDDPPCWTLPIPC